MTATAQRTSDLFEPLNAAMRPLIKRGLGNPLFVSPGVTVLEVVGRSTGVTRSVPLTCYLAGPLLVVGTFRARSQWIKNLDAAGECHVWLWGKRRPMSVLHINEHAATLRFV